MKRRKIKSMFLCVVMVAAVFVTVAVVKNVVAEVSITERDIEDFDKKTDSTLTVINLERDVNQVDGTAYASITIYPIETDSQMTDEKKSDAMVIDIAFVLLMIVAILGIGLVYIKLKKRGNKLERMLSIGFMFMLIATFFMMAVPINVSAATTWYVDDVPGQGPGNPAEDFTSIQDAIDAASPGDIVYVYEGYYPECINIYKSLTLEGKDRDTTIIDGGGGNYVVDIQVSWVNFSGFTVTGCGFNTGSGIQIGSTNHKIFNNKVTGNQCIKVIHLNGAANCEIIDNIIENNGTPGIQAYGINLWYANGNYISKNFISSNARGLSLGFSAGNTIIKNDIISNSQYGIEIAGISSPPNNNITNNTILNSEVGIRLVASYWPSVCEDNVIKNNYISGCIYGIRPTGSVNWNHIIGNTVLNNDYGVYISKFTPWGGPSYYPTHNTVAGNLISDNSNTGIKIDNNCTDNLIYHNDIINNTNQADDSNPANNDWHHPTLLEGNYWSDYLGLDDGSGTGKHAIAGDGIGDTLIPHPTTDYDFYPFINKSGWFDRLWRRHYIDSMEVLFPTHVVTANINDTPFGAGDDVVASCLHVNTAWGAIVWYDNLGAPSFSNRIYIDNNIRMPWGVAVGDLDDDGDNDVVAVGDESYVYWYENNGSGYFLSKNILDNTLWDPKEVFIADINGDTRPDVVATGADGIQWLGRGQVKWYENLGGGSFVIGGQVIDNLPLAWGLYVADIDDDVDLDVIATSVGISGVLDDGTIVWYRNDDGLGTFTGPNPIDSGRDGCENIFAIDVDMDGYNDIVASMSDDNDDILGWYKNDGLGGFSSLIQIDINLEFNGLDIGDINYDGREDIVIATGSTDNWVIWYKNPLNPLIDPWTKRVIDDDPYPPVDARDVSITDLDKDLDLDVAGALFYKQAITWYENPLV